MLPVMHDMTHRTRKIKVYLSNSESFTEPLQRDRNYSKKSRDQKKKELFVNR